MPELFLELLSEEMPCNAQADGASRLAAALTKRLQEAHIQISGVHRHATSVRSTLWMEEVAVRVASFAKEYAASARRLAASAWTRKSSRVRASRLAAALTKRLQEAHIQISGVHRHATSVRSTVWMEEVSVRVASFAKEIRNLRTQACCKAWSASPGVRRRA